MRKRLGFETYELLVTPCSVISIFRVFLCCLVDVFMCLVVLRVRSLMAVNAGCEFRDRVLIFCVCQITDADFGQVG